MNGLGGLNKSPNGVVIGLVQLQLPVVVTPADLAAQTQTHRRDGRQGAPQHGDHGPRRLPRICAARPVDGHQSGDHVLARRAGGRGVQSRPAATTASGAASPSWSSTRTAIPTIPASIIDDTGALQLYYRKMHPWVPVEPWEPGDIGIPVMRRAEGREARAHHLPRRHVSRDGARMRLQGRRDHDPHGGLHRADPRRLALHQPGEQLPAT